MSQQKLRWSWSALAPHLVILLSVVLTVFALGKDLNWDQYNYHLYLAHAFLNERFHFDVMPASTNTHLNPLPYLPFYWMAMANWHSFAVAGVIAAWHALNISIVWTLSRQVWFEGHASARGLTILSTVLAGITPVYLAVVGATFIEASLSVLVLAALLLACLGMKDISRPSSGAYIAATGLVMGCAVGFKLTGIVFAAGLGFALMFCIPARLWIARLSPYVAGLMIGFALTNGWLMVRLWNEFGNPVFPFFNGFFQSPDFLPVNLSHDRFRWNSIGELLSLPFSMALPYNWVYVEPNLPDSRPGLLTLACGALIVKALVARIRRPAIAPSPTQTGTEMIDRVAHPGTKLTVYFVIACIPFWLVTSANARYGLPLMILVGPLLVLALTKLIKNPARIMQLLVVVIAWQLIQQAFAWPPRWDSTDWTPTWYDAHVPERLKREPFAYVSLGETHTNSFATTFLNRESVFTSIAGNTFGVAPDIPSSARHRDFMAKNAVRLRTLYAIRTTSDRISGFDRQYMDTVLAPWNLRVDYSDCEFLRINFENPELQSDPYDGPGPIDLTDRLANKYDTRLLSCRIVKGPGETDAVKAERVRISSVFDKIEQHCPLLFSPRGWYLTKDTMGWKRQYLRSDITVNAMRGQFILRRDLFGPFDVKLGSVEQWERGETPFRCERLPKHWQLDNK